MASRRRWTWIIVVASVLVVAAAVVWFEPHKLVFEEKVDEAVPQARPPDPGGSSKTAEKDPEPEVLASGSFQSLEHTTSGEAMVLELSNGDRYLRLEDLETSNGPDLRVYLSEVPASDDWHAYGERYVDLGELKANLGSQNYSIPADVDLSRYRSAVIWCRRFTVGFGVAPLDA